ncbi:MAG: ATP-dependent sacrificial sulfur transferase LarE [bacterium]|nr:ATP-dependent sacrificial sulfur transferase LarE [bacterium]
MKATEAAVDQALQDKEHALVSLMQGYGTIVVAYSGGVDSSYLADVAAEVLGENAHILIADSPSIPRAELADALALAKSREWHLTIIETNEFDNEDYLKNDGTRCYHCKSELFSRMREYAAANDLANVADGSIVDDLADLTRLGVKAAKERGVVSPLQDAGLSKADIRVLSAARELPTADKASFACLGSRFPVGTRLTRDKLTKVEQVEESLKRLGFHQYRARHHDDVCRIEIDPADFERLLDETTREQIVRDATAAGYRFVTLDLRGYRTGSTAGPAHPA